MSGEGLVPAGGHGTDPPGPWVPAVMLGFPALSPLFRAKDADPETQPKPRGGCVVSSWPAPPAT